MRLLCVFVILTAARAHAAPAFDAKDLAAVDAAVPALVADKDDCHKLGRHAAIVAGALDKIAAGKPTTPSVVTSDVGPRLLRHAVAVQGALAGPCLSKLDQRLVTRLAYAMVRAPISVSIAVAPKRDLDKDFDKVPTPKPIPHDDQQLLGLVDFYLRVAIPTDAERPTMLFMRANVLRRHAHLEKALPIFLEIIAKHPRHETAEYAANLALDSYNRLQKYDALVALAQRLRDQPGFLDKRDDLRASVDRILQQAARKTAEQCERKARSTKDRGAYAECAERYIAMYNANPSADNIDEMLYNAAILYQQAGSVGAALQLFAVMRQRAPRSHLTQRALAAQGFLYSKIGMFAESAASLEEYATKYAGEKDALFALSDALLYRRALGDTAKAIADARQLQRLFGARKPVEAAAAQHALVAIARDANDDTALVQHATEYLKRYAGRDVNARVSVTVELAQAMMRRSCSVAGIDGLCVEHARSPGSTSCGSAPKLRVIARKRTLVDQAKQGFKEAITIADRTPGVDASAQHAALLARIAIADLDLEVALGGTAPPDVKALGALLASKQQRFERALQQYAARGKQLPALARVGLAHQRFGESLLALEVPRAVRGKRALVDAYCQELETATRPIEQRAIAAYDACVAVARDANVVDAWSRSCQRGLAELARGKVMAVVEPVLAPHVARIAIQLEPALAPSAQFAEFRRLEGKWRPADCERVGKQLLAAAATKPRAEHATFAYMAGLAFQRCSQVAPAERAYRTAGLHGRSLSNLGAIAAGAGRAADAKRLWTDAIKVDGKLVAARTNLAAIQLDELRLLPVKDAVWKRLADDIQFQLSNALAVDAENVAARVAFALLYFEGLERSRSRLEIGKIVLRDLEAATPRDPAVTNALAIYDWRRGQTSTAHDGWKAAADPSAPFNLALATLAIGKHAEAKAQLLALKPASMHEYDRALALGVAHRALGEHAAAEAAYAKAIQIAEARPEAHFALGVLQEQVATRVADRTAARAAYLRAADGYRKAADRATGALKASALAAAAEVDRTLAKLP